MSLQVRFSSSLGSRATPLQTFSFRSRALELPVGYFFACPTPRHALLPFPVPFSNLLRLSCACFLQIWASTRRGPLIQSFFFYAVSFLISRRPGSLTDTSLGTPSLFPFFRPVWRLVAVPTWRFCSCACFLETGRSVFPVLHLLTGAVSHHVDLFLFSRVFFPRYFSAMYLMASSAFYLYLARSLFDSGFHVTVPVGEPMTFPSCSGCSTHLICHPSRRQDRTTLRPFHFPCACATLPYLPASREAVRHRRRFASSTLCGTHPI